MNGWRGALCAWLLVAVGAQNENVSKKLNAVFKINQGYSKSLELVF
jgi:hypothetical protein